MKCKDGKGHSKRADGQPQGLVDPPLRARIELGIDIDDRRNRTDGGVRWNRIHFLRKGQC